MTSLIELKEKIKNFYGSYEFVVRPIIRFLAGLISLLLIKANVGYMDLLSSWIVVLGVAVICAFLPWGAITLVLAVDIVMNIFAVSVELGGMVAIIMMIMFLLFFRFSPKQGMLLVFVPLAFFLKIPYIVPIIAGLVCTPAAVVSVIFGTIIYYIIYIISENLSALTGSSSGAISTANINSIINMINSNTEMILAIIAFTITTLVVYSIKRLSIDNAWTIAIITGSVLEFVVILVGNLVLKNDNSVAWTVIGTLISLVIAFVVQFFVFSVDYSRTEHTQFEDDEYYYYVKAVPKMTVAAPTNTVKKINTQRRPANQTAHPAGQGRPSGQSRSGGQNIRSAEGSARSVVTERTAPARSSAPYGQQNPYRGREMTGGRSVTISSDHMAQDDSDDYEELF